MVIPQKKTKLTCIARGMSYLPEIKPTGHGQTVYRQVSTRLEQAPELPIEFSILFSKVTFHFISEWFFPKSHEIVSVVMRPWEKLKKDSQLNRESWHVCESEKDKRNYKSKIPTQTWLPPSLRSRRLEVVGARKNSATQATSSSIHENSG